MGDSRDEEAGGVGDNTQRMQRVVRKELARHDREQSSPGAEMPPKPSNGFQINAKMLAAAVSLLVLLSTAGGSYAGYVLMGERVRTQGERIQKLEEATDGIATKADMKELKADLKAMGVALGKVQLELARLGGDHHD